MLGRVIVLAYVAPTLRSVGDAVTAADQNIIANDILQFAPFVQGVFTTEAVRNAAITSPTEGMHAYLTASTETTAAGTNTAIPTGIQTIYDGSGWVTVTDVGAWSPSTSTRAVASFGATTGAGTDPAVTLRTGTTALVSWGAYLQNSGGGQTMQMSIVVSGATTIAAGSDPLEAILYVPTGFVYHTLSANVLVTGLTAGINTFTTSYHPGGGTSYWYARHLNVKGIA